MCVVMMSGQSRIVLVVVAFLILETVVRGEDCRNNIPNCSAYNKQQICTSGNYPDWTKANCKQFCGLCTRSTPCQDNIKDCPAKGKESCDKPNIQWGKDNCEASCGFCQAPPCKDKLDNCQNYGDSACNDPYLVWAKENCPKTCGFCHSGKSITPVTPPPNPVSGVSGKDKELIINTINNIRSRVQPPATDMPKVIWDESAATLAQVHTDKCVWGIARDQRIGAYGSAEVKMVIGYGYDEWTGALAKWESAKNNFQYGKDPDSYLGDGGWKKIATYTQLVTNTVVRVGCGFSKCSNLWNTFYACNFVAGQELTRPYESGERCASCPRTCFTGLCDCGGLLCLNGEKLDVNTCTCT